MLFSPSLVSVTVLMVLFIWMDASLYFHIQNDIKPSQDLSNIYHEDNLFQTKTAGSCSLINTLLSYRFEFAFRSLSIKQIMCDPIDSYIFSPLADLFAQIVDFRRNLLFITPNIVSYAGVASAMVAAKLVSYDNSKLHKLSFLVFQFRTWFDDLDGVVARARLGIHKHVSLSQTQGYIVDGVCDSIGFASYIFGCYMFLKNSDNIKSAISSYMDNQRLDYEDQQASKCGKNDNLQRKPSHKSIRLQQTKYQKTDHNEVDDYSMTIFKSKLNEVKLDNEPNRLPIVTDNVSTNLLFLIVCFGFQLVLCASFWNRCILVFSDLLESKSDNEAEVQMKIKIFKSNATFAIMWLWRFTNGHSFMQMLVAAVYFGKLKQFLEFIKYKGFIGILLLALMTEIYILDIKNYLS